MASTATRQLVELLLVQSIYLRSALDARHLIASLQRQLDACVDRGRDLHLAAEALGIRSPDDADAYAAGVREELALHSRIQEAIAAARRQLPGLEAREKLQREIALAIVAQFPSRADAPVHYRRYITPGYR